MSFNYWELKKRAALYWLKPILDNGSYHVRRSDGRLEPNGVFESVTSPWHHIDYSKTSMCPFLQTLCMDISPRTPVGRFVPRRCQECWKIVIRPRTIKELFELERVMVELRWPSKCGIERRSYTPCSKYRYGGYIYSRSIEEGFDRLEKIRQIVEDNPILNGIEVFFKRACTEMEMSVGPSNEWSISKEQHEVEDLIEHVMHIDIPLTYQATHVLDNLHMTWIEWAAEIGDETYLEYTDGKPLYTPAVRYERKAEGTDEVTPDSEAVSAGSSSPAVPKGSTRRKTKKKDKK